MATPRAAQKEMTPGLLLGTALELFGKQEYAATKMDDITRTAGTTRVTFYAHFSGHSEPEPARRQLDAAAFGALSR